MFFKGAIKVFFKNWQHVVVFRHPFYLELDNSHTGTDFAQLVEYSINYYNSYFKNEE